jgi:DNA-binding NarL/FixJ family response regulator
MSDNLYAKMQALVVDDFESFRITLSKMLQEFGVATVDSAPSSNEALRYCNSKVYDIILCDQNLGKGKTGQQILEALRHTTNLNSDSLFVLVSAESNKSIIMAAYDYEPDAYLTKPITGQTLGQRLERLFKQRIALAPIYNALKEKQLQTVVKLCEEELNSARRYASACQKLLGKALLETGNYEKAENLYREILDVRQLDWAMLGMAHVKIMQGDSLSAQQWLEETIQFNPMCLKAYDLLAEILAARADYQGQQKVLQQAVDISPLSILRQQSLGDVGFKNNDLLVAANAYRKAVKLGENSVHDNVNFHESFAHAGIQLAKLDKNLASPFLRDALKVVSEIPVRFGKNKGSKIASSLLESQLYAVSGEERRAVECLLNAKKVIDSEEAVELPLRIELVRALRELGKEDESERMIAELLKEFADDEDQLQQIDCLLDEPCSAKNKALVAQINKSGIAFYEAKDFARAVDCFASALRDFPQHIGLRLNLVQALLGQLKQEPGDDQVLTTAQQTLDYIRKIIPDQHVQYRRFRQLDDGLRGLTSTKRH